MVGGQFVRQIQVSLATQGCVDVLTLQVFGFSPAGAGESDQDINRIGG